MTDTRKIDPATNTETTGHSWDGIEELNTPLPRWWLWTFYATIVWGVIYTILYPAWPLVPGATAGLLGYSTRAEVAAEIERVALSNADLERRLTSVDLTALQDDEPLHRFAVQAGRSVFAANCSQCHGAGAGGVVASGYPNLLDDDWLWGGSIDDIAYTVRHGIRNEEDPDTRFSEMPPFDWMDRSEQDAIAHFVRSLSDLAHDPVAADTGAGLFADNCSSCHGEAGQGDRTLGAPNLADAIWLRGSSHEAILRQLGTPRMGVMPAWQARLGEADVRAVAAYVHGLGGGEATAADPSAPAPAPASTAAPAPAPAAADDPAR
ncbi:cytochrome-c oxidase, cbb3-type subunit III [Pacificitalea manganoxidans]|uniref:Cbb3-type cytochrome c oxidase subunit n=1 Tax=Pacificitalea manganoxidans TaxID=1411902 RepID=A0A291LY23_9RHOB|nr:cytochrome-c oxidase, cbb3-type subunit III [Pacificitalea manganoxidans]ATI41592.1 cytochrome-c oxidase, cbb3-type subunit III [Pacificitalea manganoxidans]MDR6309019.1 cytochrome c oxidase cbb3-type subunit 3 [Pacificitalea manganoxidans]